MLRVVIAVWSMVMVRSAVSAPPPDRPVPDTEMEREQLVAVVAVVADVADVALVAEVAVAAFPLQALEVVAVAALPLMLIPHVPDALLPPTSANAAEEFPSSRSASRPEPAPSTVRSLASTSAAV